MFMLQAVFSLLCQLCCVSTEVGKFDVVVCLSEGSKVVYSVGINSSIGIFHQYEL